LFSPPLGEVSSAAEIAGKSNGFTLELQICNAYDDPGIAAHLNILLCLTAHLYHHLRLLGEVYFRAKQSANSNCSLLNSKSWNADNVAAHLRIL